MRPATLLSLSSLASLTHGLRILQGNDDGWAELYVRALLKKLVAANYDTVLVAPAQNLSGSGSLRWGPIPRFTPCHYDSCEASSSDTHGADELNPRLNWVNGSPVTALVEGFEEIAENAWRLLNSGEAGLEPEFVVSGPNVGRNIYLSVPISGTVGVAAYAASEEKLPAVAFSGVSEGFTAYDDTSNTAALTASAVYADLGTHFVDALTAGGAPFIPEGIFLSVNFPRVTSECASLADFKWVASRAVPAILGTPDDAAACGGTRLPTETTVHETDGCFISVSVLEGQTKTDANAMTQRVVIERLGALLSCLP